MAIELNAEALEQAMINHRNGRLGSVQRDQSFADLAEVRRALDEETTSLRDRINRHRGRLTEDDIAEGIVKVLRSFDDHEASIGEIKERLPEVLNLSKADRARSDTRPSEQVWEQLVRNIVSHRTVKGNLIQEGVIKYLSKGRLRLADADW